MLDKEVDIPKVVEEKKKEVVVEKNDKAKIGADRFKPKAKTEQPQTEPQVIAPAPVQEPKKQTPKEIPEAPVQPVKKGSVSESNQSQNAKKKVKKNTTNANTIATKNVLAKWDE